mgnify:CR=1 FL=1
MKKYIVFPLLLLGGFFAAGCGTKNTADDNSLVVLNYGKYLNSFTYVFGICKNIY